MLRSFRKLKVKLPCQSPSFPCRTCKWVALQSRHVYPIRGTERSSARIKSSYKRGNEKRWGLKVHRPRSNDFLHKTVAFEPGCINTTGCVYTLLVFIYIIYITVADRFFGKAPVRSNALYTRNNILRWVCHHRQHPSEPLLSSSTVFSP